MDSRAGSTLAKSATESTPKPAIPVFESPTKYAASAALVDGLRSDTSDCFLLRGTC